MAVLRWERTVTEQYWPGEDLPRKIEGPWMPILAPEEPATEVWWGQDGNWIHECPEYKSRTMSNADLKFCSQCGVQRPSRNVFAEPEKCDYEWVTTDERLPDHDHHCSLPGRYNEHPTHVCGGCSARAAEVNYKPQRSGNYETDRARGLVSGAQHRDYTSSWEAYSRNGGDKSFPQWVDREYFMRTGSW